MEKTITLPLEEYNELLEYKKAFITKMVISTTMSDSFAFKFSYTESEFVEKAIKELDQIVSKIDEFKKIPWHKRIFYKF